MKHPLISVIVTTHERPLLLTRCLESLLDQDFVDFEILVCSDESSVQTAQTAHTHLRPQDSFLSLPGLRGPSATRNIGCQVAKGEWICFLDDDDTFDCMYLATASGLLQSNSSCVHYFNYERITERRLGSAIEFAGKEVVDLGKEHPESLHLVNFIPNNSYFAPRGVAGTCRFDEHLRSVEDWDYLLTLKSKTTFKHHPIIGPRVHFAEEPGRNIRAVNDGNMVFDTLSVYRKWPAHNCEQRQQRQQYLGRMGLDLPEQLL